MNTKAKAAAGAQGRTEPNNPQPQRPDPAFIATPQAASAPLFTFEWRQMVEFLRAQGFNVPAIPGWGRVLITFALGVGLAMAAFPIVTALAGALVAGAATLTASVFLLNAVWIVAALAAAMAAAWVIVKACGFVLGGKVDKAAASVRNNIAWAVMPDPKPMQAA